jgi:hypothetical protein
MATTTCVHHGKAARISYFPKRNSWTDPLLAWTTDVGLQQWLGEQQNTILQLINQLDSLFRVEEPDGTWAKWRIGLCDECHQPLFLVLDANEQRIVRTFPPISLERPPHVPPGVADDYVEAALCLSVGAYKGAVAMCRRALQAAALERQCKRAKLMNQLDDLGDKGLLNAKLLEVAHQVRHFGNYGSHPDDDGLGEVSQDEADTIHKLTWQVLEDLYVNPARVNAMKASLAAKETAPVPRVEATPEEHKAATEGLT